MSSLPVLSSAPFVVIEGVINVRTIGGYKTNLNTSHIVNPKLAFRSGEVSSITDKGKEQFIALGIRRVFDLRTNLEITSYKTASPDIPGVEFVHLPVGKEDPWGAGSVEQRSECLPTSVLTYLNYFSSLKRYEENELEVFNAFE
jgi:protein tyrosine/serine phosphatase